ncbi:G-type lectin S-receptor-like serine/threonine-protein kinase At1g11303 [Miscanthus floridulus]|uniref:G-type lectin S-receptor-like serine/threonine-protein kinase At1g11303 n=1 Tax=Miscanthus floridulus TaxID=154761 RepID=UPI003457AD03
MADVRERLLCFEYIRNGSLDQHLSDELRGLEWQTRYQIIIGICRGLHYLHKDKEIIHMDLKPGNILLDDLMVPKITDFGLSRPESDSHATTTRLITPGYTAPEYISGGKATSKSDIYSLGVIIIELVTGSRTKPNITKVIRRWNHRWIKSMEQSSLGYQQVAKCLELALRCTQDEPKNRPDISDIIDELKEIDTKYGQAQIQDILGIEPLEIHIPFEEFKISHSIELTNDTDDHIAFVTKSKLERFYTEPDRGIVPPRSKCSVTLAMQAQVSAQPNEHYTEVITVLSTRGDDGALATMDIVTAGDIFIDSEEGKVVDEMNVMVVFGTLELPGEE